MQTLVVDTGMLIRLASATTSSGGNLLNTLLQPGVKLVIPDAVWKEATYNPSFADSAIISAWLVQNSGNYYEPITSAGIAAAHSFSTAALDYISQNASLINQVASTLGVSPEAISGSIAREITRNDFITLQSAVLRADVAFLAPWSPNSTLSSY
jgi:hypothetical protein